MGVTYLVVGLGNIGAEYANTRHNMGFMILDAWAQASNVLFKTDRYGDVAEVSWKGRWFVLLKPSTYMNLSGKAVRYWMQQLNLPLENLVVISDDLNLPFGTLRMRAGGSSGGHNGLENIAEMLESEQWARIRVGIGNNFSRGAQVDFVLGDLSAEEKEQIPPMAEKIVRGLKDFCTMGVQRAMNTVNAKPAPPKPAPATAPGAPAAAPDAPAAPVMPGSTSAPGSAAPSSMPGSSAAPGSASPSVMPDPIGHPVPSPHSGLDPESPATNGQKSSSEMPEC